MRIKAALYNADHLEYGLVTIPFPIPQDQYNDTIKMLEALDIEERHIVSVFKLVQELLAPSGVKGKNQFQLLLTKLPPDHKAQVVRRRRFEYLRAGHDVGDLHSAVPAERVPGQRDGADPVFRHRYRCGDLLQ